VRSHALVLGTAYAVGAVPVSQLFARALRDGDLRAHGTGTVSASGLQPFAGIRAVVAAGAIDVAKGTAGPLLAGRRTRLAAAAGAVTVVAHNWSPLLRWAGGRGISPALGALAVTAPEGAALLLGAIAAGRVLGETAIGALAGYVGLTPMLQYTRGKDGTLLAIGLVAPMIAKRITGNHPAPDAQTYVWRLLLDRDRPAKP
jgi:glycerol-3-phosphate acyltransferase PlsY